MILNTNKNIIIHNDGDGMISGLFMRNRGHKFAGFFDLKKAILQEGSVLTECLGVDVDFSLKEVDTIGHHITLKHHDNHINLNQLFDSNNHSFSKKFPLSTILSLYYLTETPLPTDMRQRALLFYIDGINVSAKKYTWNVQTWIKKLGFEELLNEYKEGKYDTYFPEFIQMASKYGFYPSPKRPNPQMTFKLENYKSILPLMKEIATIMEWEFDESELASLTQVVDGYHYSFDFNSTVDNEVKKLLDENAVLSHGLLYSSLISVTTTKPLSYTKDKLLLKSLNQPYGRKTLITA